MAEVIVLGTDGAYSKQTVAAIGTVTAEAAGGLAIVGGEVGFDATVGGRGITETNGVLAVSLPAQGAKTAISTVGAGTLTAASIVNGLIMRTGPTTAYTDTTDTATAILALLDGPAIGDSWEFTHVNGVAFACTLAAGADVTLAGTTANAASKVRRYHVEVTNVVAPAVTITGVGEMVA